MAKGTSRGEIKIAEILEFNDIDYEQEYIFPDLVASSNRNLRFDFAVKDDDGNVDFLIEFQGEQHYKSFDHFGGKKKLSHQKYNDLQKIRYCNAKHIPLVVIPYWDYDIMDYDYIMNAADKKRI